MNMTNMPNVKEIDKVSKDVGEQQGLAWLYLGQFADLIRLLNGQATGMTDAKFDAVEIVFGDDDETLVPEERYNALLDHARLLEAALSVARMEAIKECAKACAGPK